MRLVTDSDVMNWSPDVAGLSPMWSRYQKSAIARSYDITVQPVPVWIVRIVNVYDDTIYSARIAGEESDVENAADDLLSTFCRRWPGTFLTYRIQRFVPKD